MINSITFQNKSNLLLQFENNETYVSKKKETPPIFILIFFLTTLDLVFHLLIFETYNNIFLRNSREG